jgi:hypothetical protein
MTHAVLAATQRPAPRGSRRRRRRTRHVVALPHKGREVGRRVVLPLRAQVVLQDLLLGRGEVVHGAEGKQERLALAVDDVLGGGGGRRQGRGGGECRRACQ